MNAELRMIKLPKFMASEVFIYKSNLSLSYQNHVDNIRVFFTQSE